MEHEWWQGKVYQGLSTILFSSEIYIFSIRDTPFICNRKQTNLLMHIWLESNSNSTCVSTVEHEWWQGKVYQGLSTILFSSEIYIFSIRDTGLDTWQVCLSQQNNKSEKGVLTQWWIPYSGVADNHCQASKQPSVEIVNVSINPQQRLAYGQKCSFCHKPDHFSKVCHSRQCLSQWCCG